MSWPTGFMLWPTDENGEVLLAYLFAHWRKDYDDTCLHWMVCKIPKGSQDEADELGVNLDVFFQHGGFGENFIFWFDRLPKHMCTPETMLNRMQNDLNRQVAGLAELRKQLTFAKTADDYRKEPEKLEEVLDSLNEEAEDWE